MNELLEVFMELLKTKSFWVGIAILAIIGFFTGFFPAVLAFIVTFLTIWFADMEVEDKDS